MVYNFNSALLLSLMILIIDSEAEIQDIMGKSLVVPDPSMVRALKWLEKQRKPDYGFQDHTAEAVVIFQLANTSSWYVLDDFLNSLIVKQMDIEILLKLLRRHETFPGPKELALYSMALNSLCRDPRGFYGHNLISYINHQETLLDWEFGISSLAICISGAHVRKRQIRRLLDITEQQNKPINIETFSTVIMALRCIIEDHKNRHLQHYLLNPIKKLGQLQKENGSFGDLRSSAFAIQALMSTDPGGNYWNKTTAINYVKNQQNSDGSFGNDNVIYTTMLVLLGLGPQSLTNLRDMNCGNEMRENWSNPLTLYALMPPNKAAENDLLEENKTAMFQMDNSRGINGTDWTKADITLNDSVTVSYTLWIGSNATQIYAINITTENNDSFYNVMQLAAQKDNHFSFLSTEWPNGHYVHTLAGHKEEPMSYHYWLLYKLPIPPDSASPPPNQFVAPVGVDELLVEDGDHFLFWCILQEKTKVPAKNNNKNSSRPEINAEELKGLLCFP